MDTITGPNHFYHITERGICSRYQKIEETLKTGDKTGFIWLAFSSPVQEDLDQIITIFPIHPLSIEDCFDDNQIPKIDIFREYTSILFNNFYYADGVLSITELNLFLGENFLITVSREETRQELPIGKIMETLRQHPDQIAKGPAFVMHTILDCIVDQKFEIVETIEDEIIALEDNLIANPAAFMPQELQKIRRNLMSMRKSLVHEKEVMTKSCRKDSRFIPDSSIFFYSDILDHLVKFYETTEASRDIVTSLIQMNLSTTSNTMAEAANRTNRSVSRLTLITTIFMPLTLLAGIGGMSEWTMMTGAENWKTAYPLMLAGMAVIGVLTYVFLKRLNERK